MESPVVFSHSSPPVYIRDYANAALPVQVPVFSDDADSQSTAGTATS
jgi:hypothetical protein